MRRALPLLSCLLLCVGLLSCEGTSAADWPDWRGPSRDGVWSETGLIDRFEGDEIPIRWRAPIGSGYSGPTVAEGRVYVADRVTEPEERERVHCFDVETGEPIWTHAYACEYRGVSFRAGPRCAVIIDRGLAFMLGTMGHLHCFDAATGEVAWSRDLGAELGIDVPIWGVAAHPIVWGDLLLVQAGDPDGGCVLGLERETGHEVWRALDDRPSYSSPIVIEQAGEDVAVVWTGDHIAGLDPASGRVYWKHAIPPLKMVDFVVSPVAKGDRLFLSSFYDGSRLFRIRQDTRAVEELWHIAGPNEFETRALHAMMSAPVLDGDHIYGIDSFGQLRCLEAATGARVWEDLTAAPNVRWGNAHLVRNGDRYWLFNERGELIIATLSPDGFEEISRAKLIEPTEGQLSRRRPVCWSHPAFAARHVFARNDRELVCASLAAE